MTFEGVFACFSVEAIASFSSVYEVVSCFGFNEVVSSETTEDVVLFVADEQVFVF